MSVIRVSQLRKEFRVPIPHIGPFAPIRSLFSFRYTTKVAVDSVSFTIERGETVGYIGPNGAGKSTTIKMLAGIMVPTSGLVEVNGFVPHRQRREHLRHIGAVFGQKSQLWWDVPVKESLLLLKEIYKIPAASFESSLGFFCELLDLHEFIDTPVRQLSLGQRVRADIVAALLHSPEILFLDEPTIGLDVVARERIRSFIETLNRERKVTVLLTTHDMSDMERLCSRILIIDRGQLIYDGPLNRMKERFRPHRVLVVDFADGVSVVGSQWANMVSREGQRARFRFDGSVISASALIADLAGRYPIKDITVQEPAIEEIVRDIYRTAAERHMQKKRGDGSAHP